MSSPFPLVTLQPASDARNLWVALLLDADPPCDDGALARIFGEFGLREALGDLPCVVSLTALPDKLDALPPSQTILRLPVEFCSERANDGRLDAARIEGYRIMATGIPQAGQTLWEGVGSLALACPGRSAPSGVAAWLCKLPGPHLALDAAEIVCPGRCHFHWLARHFSHAALPPAGRGGDAPNRLLLLELLAKVANDADSHEIENIIKRDPQLSYHLLKLVNSVAFSLTTKIASFHQAIALLGRRQLQRWLQLLLYAHAQGGDMANPLLPQAALRAGLTEALCAAAGGSRDDQDRAFMAGMFSLLDMLFGMPIADIVEPLNLAAEVQSALIERGGSLGLLLKAAEAGEASPAPVLASTLAEAGISHEVWAQCLVHAAQWAIQVSREA